MWFASNAGHVLLQSASLSLGTDLYEKNALPLPGVRITDAQF